MTVRGLGQEEQKRTRVPGPELELRSKNMWFGCGVGHQSHGNGPALIRCNRESAYYDHLGGVVIFARQRGTGCWLALREDEYTNKTKKCGNDPQFSQRCVYAHVLSC